MVPWGQRYTTYRRELAVRQAERAAKRAAREAAGKSRPYVKPLSKTLRQQVIARDGLVCQLCSQPVAADDIDIDHIVPRSQGGSDNLDNLRVTHSFCNRSRGAARPNYTPIEAWTPALHETKRREGRKHANEPMA